MTAELDLDLVRQLHPPAEHAGAGDARECARASLLTEIDRRPNRQPTSKHPRWRRPRLASLGALGALGVAAAVAAVAAGVIVALSLRGGAANPPPAAAKVVLRRAAIAAEASGGPRQLRPGEYWYVKSIWTIPGVRLRPNPPGAARTRSSTRSRLTRARPGSDSTDQAAW